MKDNFGEKLMKNVNKKTKEIIKSKILNDLSQEQRNKIKDISFDKDNIFEHKDNSENKEFKISILFNDNTSDYDQEKIKELVTNCLKNL